MLLLYTKCQSSFSLASHWSRVYHVNVKKVDCFPCDKSRRAIICYGPVNNRTGSHVPLSSAVSARAFSISIRTNMIEPRFQWDDGFICFVFFDTWYIIKHLLTVTSGKQYVLWSLDRRCFPRLRLGKHQRSRDHNTYCFPRFQSISVKCFPSGQLFVNYCPLGT